MNKTDQPPASRPHPVSTRRVPRRGATKEFTIAWSAIFRVVFVAALLALTFLLGRLIALIFFALLLSLALWKVVQAGRRVGLPRPLGIALAAFIVLGFVGGFVGFLVPAVANQGSVLISRLPVLQKQIVEHLPAAGPIRDALNKGMQSASFSDPKPLIEGFMSWGRAVLTGLSEFLVILIIAIYFLIDGERIHQWLLAFFPAEHRAKARLAAPQIVDVVARYVGGQFVTSLLAGTYAFLVLHFLKVPNAALLAVVAAVFDILPVIGLFLFLIPALALAFTVSPLTAGLTALLYGVYHLLETYLIVPRVYGNQLKLSTLTVLIACMAGWLLGGVLGAIAILPVVASYPIIEKLWLQPHLEPDTVAQHTAIDKQAHPETA